MPFIVWHCFERQAADLLPRISGRVLSRQVAFERLRVFAFERREMVVVDDQASGLQCVISP